MIRHQRRRHVVPAALIGGFVMGLLFAGFVQPVLAQTVASGVNADSGFAILQGRWVRPDGGYTITIRRVDASGKLDADYANPRPLPFAKAEASRDGKAIQMFLELRAGGYNGSSYTLAYVPEQDQLRGVYYQAVTKQRFDVMFKRAK